MSGCSGQARVVLPLAWLSMLAPLTFISIMLASTRTLERTQIEAYIHTHTCMHTHTHACMHAHTYIHMHHASCTCRYAARGLRRLPRAHLCICMHMYAAHLCICMHHAHAGTQLEAYGDSPEFIAYRQVTPRLLPNLVATSRVVFRSLFPDGWNGSANGSAEEVASDGAPGSEA
mgnify:CR=1 FL=1